MYRTEFVEIMVDVMTEEEVPNTTFLKSVVIILGILIVGVASVIIFTIYKRAMTSSPETEISATPVPDVPRKRAPALTEKFGDVVLEAPAGMSPLSVTSSDERLIITYGVDQLHPEMIIVLHPTSGEVLGRIILKK